MATKGKATTQAFTVKAVVGYGMVSGSKKDGNAVWGLKVWDGQTVESGDLVAVVNRYGQETLVVVGELVRVVHPDVRKGTMGYSLWTKAEISITR